MNVNFPFTDDPIKRDILAACDQGKATGNWNPLLKQLWVALGNQSLRGPFFMHAEFEIDSKFLYNYCIAEIDLDAVDFVKSELRRFGGFEVIQNRYKEYFGGIPPMPIHFPARILAANETGNAGHPATVAWFLHEMLPRIDKASLEFVCGIELVSSWESRFNKVYRPAAERVLDDPSRKALADLIGDLSFGKFTALYATLHDTGHWLGSMACLPESPAFARHLPVTWWGAFGELMTDMAMVTLMFDLAPSSTAFVLTSRLFDYMHRGIGPDPLVTALNQQFDTLANTLLFERMRKAGALTPAGDRFHFEIDGIRAVASQLLVDLNRLGTEMAGYEAEGSPERVLAAGRDFIGRDLPSGENLWQFPPAVQALLTKMQDLPLELKWATILPSYPYQQLLEEKVLLAQ